MEKNVIAMIEKGDTTLIVRESYHPTDKVVIQISSHGDGEFIRLTIDEVKKLLWDLDKSLFRD